MPWSLLGVKGIEKDKFTSAIILHTAKIAVIFLRITGTYEIISANNKLRYTST